MKNSQLSQKFGNNILEPVEMGLMNIIWDYPYHN